MCTRVHGVEQSVEATFPDETDIADVNFSELCGLGMPQRQTIATVHELLSVGDSSRGHRGRYAAAYDTDK